MAEDGKVEVFTGVNVVGFLLITLAGWIDIVGFKMFFNQRSAFMTGRASHLGWRFSQGGANATEGWFILVVVLAFMTGAFIGRKLTKSMGLAAGLGFTGVVVMITAWLVGPVPGAFTGVKCTLNHFASGRTLLGILIPMALGCQNATTSSTPINRTTHLTGPATDIGTTLANGDINGFIFWLFRWIGFPLGAFIGWKMVLGGNAPMALGLAGLGVVVVGIVQKFTVDIPLK